MSNVTLNGNCIVCKNQMNNASDSRYTTCLLKTMSRIWPVLILTSAKIPNYAIRRLLENWDSVNMLLRFKWTNLPEEIAAKTLQSQMLRIHVPSTPSHPSANSSSQLSASWWEDPVCPGDCHRLRAPSENVPAQNWIGCLWTSGLEGCSNLFEHAQSPIR